MSTLVQSVRDQAARYGDRTLFDFLESGEVDGPVTSLSYAALELRARAVAARLQQTRKPGDVVLLLFPPGLDFIEAFYGALFAGVVPVPLYPPDPMRLQRTLPRLRAIAATAGAHGVLSTGQILGMKPLFADQAPELAALEWIAADGVADGVGVDWSEPELRGESVAFLQYTSGSTATPKGVVISHANALANVAMIGRAFALDPEVTTVSWLPQFHDMGLVGHVIKPVVSGLHQVWMGPHHFLQRPGRWLRAVSHTQAFVTGAPNFGYDLAARKVGPEEVARLDLSCWKQAYCGSEPVRTSTIDAFVRTFGPAGFSRRAFSPCYGLAEATLLVSSSPAGKDPVVDRVDTAGDGGEPVELVGCGPVGDEVVIVDPESGRPTDGIGEIWVSGPAVGVGYWGDPEATERTFGNRLPGRAERFLRTGDLGAVRDGELYVTGRLKDLIVVRGRNLYPHDLEEAVHQRFAWVRPGNCAVFALRHGNTEAVGVAAEIRDGFDGDLDQAMGQIADALTAAFDCPVRAVALLPARALPKTSSGKIQRSACARALETDSWEAFATGQFARAEEELDAGAPTSLSAEALCADLVAACARLTGRRDIAADRPLADQGVDSMAQVHLVTRLEAQIGRPVTITLVHDHPTIAGLVGAVLGAAPLEDPSAPSDPVLYPALEARMERLDRRRPEKYRFDGADVPWSLAGAPGVCFPDTYLADTGFDPAVLAATPELAELVQWGMAAGVCAFFSAAETFLCRFVQSQQAQVGRSRSIGWFVEEEEKHTRLFLDLLERYRQRDPARYLQLAEAWRAHSRASFEPFEQRWRFEREDVRHYVFWSMTVFFEEWTIYFARLLEQYGDEVQPLWLAVHRLHAREEIQHVATDRAYLDALDLSAEERRRWSRAAWAWIAQCVFEPFVQATAVRELVAERFGGVDLGAPRPLTRTTQWQDILHRSDFARTREVLPVLAEIAAGDRPTPDADELASWLPQAWVGAGAIRRTGPTPLKVLRASGSREPVFFVHSGLGGIEPYLAWCPFLDPEQPVYAFEARGLSDGQAPATSLPEMARDYVDVLLERFPTGPYTLGGYSQGGAISWLMARELEARGRRVRRILMVDSWIPGSLPQHPVGDVDAVQELWLQAEELGVPVGDRPGTLEEAWARIGEVLADAPDRLEAVRRRVRVSTLGIAMFGDGRPFQGTVDTDVVLFRATRPTAVPRLTEEVVAAHMASSPDYGWGERITGSMTVYPVGGHHLNLSRDPATSILGWALEGVLRGPPRATPRTAEGSGASWLR